MCAPATIGTHRQKAAETAPANGRPEATSRAATPTRATAVHSADAEPMAMAAAAAAPRGSVVNAVPDPRRSEIAAGPVNDALRRRSAVNQAKATSAQARPAA